METIIYYFTGTGNSLKVAKDVREHLKEGRLVKICRDNMSMAEENTSDKVGIVYPVYFGGIPLIVKEFLEALKLEKHSYFFAIATYGSGAGASIKQIEEIINKKEVNLSAGFGINMPGNYQVMYPPYPEEKQQKFFKDEKEQIVKIAEMIKNRQTNRMNSNVAAEMFSGLMYKIFNPKDKDKNFWANGKCNGCATCSKVCPANNIEMSEGIPKWHHKCELCVACMQWCPQQAIQYKKNTVKRGRYHNPDVKVSEIINDDKYDN